MYLLCDCPEETLRMFPEAKEAALPPELRKLCEPFCHGKPLHGFQTDLALNLLVIKEAPGSQFSLLQEKMRQNSFFPDGFCCLALTGHKFRGQRSRSWAVLPGNIHLCAAFSPNLPTMHLLPGLNMLPSIAVLDVIQDLNLPQDTNVGIKWVNDVLVNGHKTAGVLAASQTKGTQIEKALLGIGLNVRVAPEIAKEGMISPTGCLADVVPDVDFTATLRALLHHLATRWQQLTEQGSAPLFTRYKELSLGIGETVEVRKDTDGAAPGEILAAGRLIDILPNLDLVLDGVPEPVRIGRLCFPDSASPTSV